MKNILITVASILAYLAVDFAFNSTLLTPLITIVIKILLLMVIFRPVLLWIFNINTIIETLSQLQHSNGIPVASSGEKITNPNTVKPYIPNVTPSKDNWKCPVCYTENYSDSEVCYSCLTPVCKHCHKPINENDQICSNCKAKLK
jgi:hypothetical protein